MLQELLDLQTDQQSQFYDRDLLTEDERREWSEDLLLGLYEEVGELARTTRRRFHVGSLNHSASNVREELVDVLKYTLALAHLQGISADEIATVFRAKTLVVEQRIKQNNMRLNTNVRVFVTDLDGCVADIEPFISKFGAYGTTPSSLENERAKGAWYEDGGFLGLPAIEGAAALLREARDNGLIIAIITARPRWIHNRIYQDTLQWLRLHGVPYDIVCFGKDKWDEVVNHVLPAKVVGFVEDRDKHCAELAAQGVQVLMVNKPYNKTLLDNEYITRVEDWTAIRRWLSDRNWGRP